MEIIIEGDGKLLQDFLHAQGRTDYFLLEGTDALQHLFSLASGIESMIVGENQIIGQLKKAIGDAQTAGTSCSLLEYCINKAIHVGIEVRKRTQINRGAVSVGLQQSFLRNPNWEH